MKILQDTKNLNIETFSIVTLGKFDGFHLGHQALFKKMFELKEKTGYPIILFTFSVSPRTQIKGEPPQFLLSNPERETWLAQTGIDYLIQYPFDEDVRHMKAEDFVQNILHDDLKTAHLVMGEDFRFGYNREGDYDYLKSKKDQMKYELWRIPEVIDGDAPISSTRIRALLSTGAIEEVNRLLGFRFYIEGTIEHGAHLGRTINMPTINVMPEDNKLLPPFGVYYTKVLVEGKWYDGVTNIGRKPTVGDNNARGVETYLLHTTGDFYGKKARVELMCFKRPERKFGSIEELKKQMSEDVKQAEVYHECHYSLSKESQEAEKQPIY